MTGMADTGSSGVAATAGVGTTGSDATAASAAGGPSYEAARDELAKIVGTLESGGLSLDESLTLWERGEELARICQRFLDGARERVDAALARADDSS
jgi:exodeoxyribonuclease VII small subunit